MAKSTKKNNKEEMMMHDHAMMHRGMKAKGILFLVIGLIFLYISYTWNPTVIAAIVTLVIALWFLSRGVAKLGWNYFGMWGCGCGCGCCGECNCEWDGK